MSTTNTRGQHLIGKEVGGCILEQLIGYGGSSAVFLAQPQTSDQKVAVKVFLPRSTMDIATQKSFYRRFLREAQAASELEHPHILSIYSYGEHQGLPYIIMPYMPGGTLADHVNEHGPLTLRQAQQYIEQIADALEYAHGQGCVHCDVKPANILLDQDGQVVLSDFGIVRFMQGALLNAQQSLKSTEMLMGTPDFASPEQALGEPLDGRSDTYSLAVTFFYLLTGFPPFRSNTPISILLMHVHDTPPKLSSARADVTPRVDEIIDKALSKWPDDRYQTVGQFSSELSEAISEAAQTRNIDKVALTPSANRTLAENRKEPDNSLEPMVEVKPLTLRTFHITRGLAIALVLSIVLLGSTTVAVVFNTTIGTHTSSRVSVTPTPAGTTNLLGMQSCLWPQSPTFNLAQDGKYYIENKFPQPIALASCEDPTYTNVRLTVNASEVAHADNGNNYYGVVLRVAENQSHYYLFEITPDNGGNFSIFRYDQGGWHLFDTGLAPSINQKLGQNNTIAVKAMGNTFIFFVNGKQVGKRIVDTAAPAFSSGEIGLYVEGRNEEVVFSNLQVKVL